MQYAVVGLKRGQICQLQPLGIDLFTSEDAREQRNIIHQGRTLRK